MINIQRILYPTDFSSYANQAYFHAVALAQRHDASLAILYVYSPSHGTPDLPGTGDNRKYWRDQLLQIRPIDHSIEVRHVFLEGDPATHIVSYATEAAMDLIVMGTHGRSALERLLVGSVAEKVLRDAPCSVLVVKLPKPSLRPNQAKGEAVLSTT
jgi:nucleotide-binding universal stress UspA family protein